MTREYCAQCKKVINACYCDKLHHYSIDSHIIILQHPTETTHTLGTARIAKLSLDNCEIITGEDFQNDKRLISICKRDDTYLVFPTLDEQNKKISLKNNSTKPKTLIFLDGTWKKAKKILFSNPFLEDIPRLVLNPEKQSLYTLRKAPKENYISTLEAIVESIYEVENKDISLTLETLRYIEKFQISKMSKGIYGNNDTDD